MRIVRFTPPAGSVLGTDPHFGVLEDETTIRAITSDPLYAGVHKLETTVLLKDMRLLAPVIPRSKVVCVGKNYANHAAEPAIVISKICKEVPRERVKDVILTGTPAGTGPLKQNGEVAISIAGLGTFTNRVSLRG